MPLQSYGKKYNEMLPTPTKLHIQTEALTEDVHGLRNGVTQTDEEV